MKFVPIEYNGKKPYTDRTGLRNAWTPGETKLVPEQDARALKRFVEFRDGQPVATSDGQGAVEAQLKQKALEAEKDTTDRNQEAILLTIQSMDKDALEAYATKYEVSLDKRRGVGTLRQEVSTLVEQFGAR